MARLERPVIVAVVINMALLAVAGQALAEEGGERVIVMPLRGPGGSVARNKIAEAIEPGVAYVAKIGAQGAQRPARTARQHKADAMVGGRIRCPGKSCIVDVIVYKASGQIWTKGKRNVSRAKLGPDSADLAVALLEEVGVLGEGVARSSEGEDGGDDAVDDDPDFDFGTVEQTTDTDDFDTVGYDGDDDDDEDRPQRSKGHDFDVVEVYLNADVTVLRNLCVNLNLVNDPRNNTECILDVENPAIDDRVYTVTPFANLGVRAVFFPGALSNRRAWWAGFGMYLDFGHSLSIRSKQEYNDNEGNIITREIGTTQMDLRAGLVYRLPIPMGRPSAPQLRFMVGYGMYRFFFNDEDYPQDHEIAARHREANPYLPTFLYHSLDVGLEFRMPILDFIFPYTSLAYRAGLSAGQAERIYGVDASINGLEWELGIRVEVAFGIRISFSTDLIWYHTTFAGLFSPKDEAEASIWGGDIVAGDRSTDLIFRLRLGVGWSF